MDNNKLSNTLSENESPDFQKISPIKNVNPPIDGRINTRTPEGTTPYRKKVSSLYKFIAILQILGLMIFLAIYASIAGKAGSEFIYMFLVLTLFPFLSIFAFINVIGFPIFLIKNKYRGKALLMPMLSILLSILILVPSMYQIIGLVIGLNRLLNIGNEIKSTTASSSTTQTAKKSDITTVAGKSKQDAINLMQSCKVDYFVGQSTNEIIAKDQNTKDWLQAAIKSSTGIEILENTPKTYIFASKSLTSELLDNVKKYRQACYEKRKLYLILDDYIETEYPMGVWTRIKL